MSTAREIELMLMGSDKKISLISHRLEQELKDLIVYGTVVAIGREVCARRARKLRRNGADVRYSGRSKNGKARFKWLMRLAITDVFKSS